MLAKIKNKIGAQMFLLLIVAPLLASPFFAVAADVESSYFPICPCCAAGEVCHLKDFFVVIDKIIKAALYLAFFIAVIMIIWGGVQILIAAGDPGQIKKGKATVTWAIWGMVVAFGAWLIINTVLVVFTGKGITDIIKIF